MRRAKTVVLTFVTAGEAANAAPLAQRAHLVTPPGEDLVRVSLVAHVPNQTVIGGVEHVMQCDGELHRAQIARQMAAGLAHAVQYEVAQLTRQMGQVTTRQAAQVGGAVEGRKQRG